jgi:hypothetical protein
MSTTTQGQKTVNTKQTTVTPMDFLPGVDPAWAQEYLGISQKYDHFTSCFLMFHISPRLVKIVVKRPESILRSMKANWESMEPGEKVTDTWEEQESTSLELWATPPKNEWKVIDLEIALDLFKAGLTPMEALIECHSDSDDGSENDPVLAGSPPMIEMMMLLMLLAMFTIGAFTYFDSAKPF